MYSYTIMNSPNPSDDSGSDKDLFSPTKCSQEKLGNKSYTPFVEIVKKEPLEQESVSTKTENIPKKEICAFWDTSYIKPTSEDALETDTKLTSTNISTSIKKELEDTVTVKKELKTPPVSPIEKKVWEAGNSSKDSSFSSSIENVSKISVNSWDSTEYVPSPSVILKRGYFGNYQLLGDSQFVRFSKEILDVRNSLTSDKRPQVGFCISGQTSAELARLVLDNYEYLNDNLIIMIGTNDVKNRVSPFSFQHAIRTLKARLEWKNILWLTIPPIPKFSDSESHMQRLKNFNLEIKKLEGGNIRVLDAYGLFIDEHNKPKAYCFEKYYESKTLPWRTDEIHLNKSGFIKLCTWLCFHLLPEKLDVIKKYRERKGSTERSKLYNEYLYLEQFLPNSSGFTRNDLYVYFMEPNKARRYRRSFP